MGEMESTRDSLSNSNQEETLPRFRNMDPQKTTRSRSSPKDQSITQPQSSAQGADCTPDHPSTRSWEVARNQVNIEEIIGTGSFGQVAKGTAMNLWGRKKTTVAVKMLKGSVPIYWFSVKSHLNVEITNLNLQVNDETNYRNEQT